MAFQIKDFTSIAASMINWMKATTTKITDFTIGGVARTLVEAPAVEIDELYQQMFIGLKEAIPVSVYNSFDFAALDARPATGVVRVTISPQTEDVLVSAGTVLATPGAAVDYTATADCVILAGATTYDVPVVANQPGVEGNIGPGRQFTLAPVANGLVSATNLSPFGNGVDAESEEDRKMRFIAFIRALNHGTTWALEYGLKLAIRYDSQGNEIERVRHVLVNEPFILDENQPIAYVRCYIHNGVAATTSALRTLATKILYGYIEEDGITKVSGWKSAGIPVDVFIATEVPVPVAGALTPLEGYEFAALKEEADQKVYDYLLNLPIDAPAVRSEIIAVVMEIEGVYDFEPSAPAANVPAYVTGTGQSIGVKLMPGTLTITA